MQTFRSLISFGLWMIFIFLLIILLTFNNNNTFEDSFKNSQKIQADFELIGDYTQSYLLETGSLPNDRELKIWGREQKFHILIKDDIWIVREPDGCGELAQNVKRTYSLCYWRSEWTEEYSPQTKETTLPSKISDYYAKWYEWLSVILIGIAAYFTSSKRKEDVE